MVLEIVAETGEEFVDFSPYVASINDDGVVHFQAETRDGKRGVYRWDGFVSAILEDARACSHPDANEVGDVCFYSDDGLVLIREGRAEILARPVGPLGPTIAGDFIGYRANDSVYLWREGYCLEVAQGHSGLQGLPVVNRLGDLVYRSQNGIYLSRGSSLVPVIELGGSVTSLGNFPFLNDSGEVSFVTDGFGAVWREGQVNVVLEVGNRFESLRGLLYQGPDAWIYYATPVGGELTIFSSDSQPVLAIGQELEGARISEFALNPVSINLRAEVVLRVGLDDSRQLIILCRK
ncbi:MAG TPA: hypothetical protein PKA27_12200 [Fimbriimonadaceae bacterium]|nr:hypothetical protein [Fimbriimonadaceae bacterium]